MGKGMAQNLHQSGQLHSVWNRTQQKAEEFSAQASVQVASSIESLAGECDLIITCVSRDQDVINVIKTIAAGIQPDSIVVDTSTVSSKTAQQAEQILKAKDAHFLDCPVSGGVEGARQGTLAMMAGGDEAILERARNTIARNIVYIGPTGSGQACKAVNQIMCAGINQAVTEALAFGEDMKLNMDRVLEVVSSGAAGNWFLDHRGKTMLKGHYDVGFKVNLHHKDLTICMEMAKQNKETRLPLVEMTLKHYEKLMDEGHGDEDISALFRLKHHNG